MLKTKPAKEVVIRMPNAIGALNHIARTISDKGVNILAVTAWVEGAQAVIRLITDDSVRVLDVLRAQKYEVQPAAAPGRNGALGTYSLDMGITSTQRAVRRSDVRLSWRRGICCRGTVCLRCEL